MTMTILTGWPPEEPILESPVDDYNREAALADAPTSESEAPLEALVDYVPRRTGSGRLVMDNRASGLVAVVGAMIFG